MMFAWHACRRAVATGIGVPSEYSGAAASGLVPSRRSSGTITIRSVRGVLDSDLAPVIDGPAKTDAVLGCEFATKPVHAGVVVESARHGGGFGLTLGLVESVVAGDVVDQRGHLAAKGLGRMGSCEFGEFAVSGEECASLPVVEGCGGTGERIGMVGADLARSECADEQRCVAEGVGAPFGPFGGAT